MGSSESGSSHSTARSVPGDRRSSRCNTIGARQGARSTVCGREAPRDDPCSGTRSAVQRRRHCERPKEAPIARHGSTRLAKGEGQSAVLRAGERGRAPQGTTMEETRPARARAAARRKGGPLGGLDRGRCTVPPPAEVSAQLSHVRCCPQGPAEAPLVSLSGPTPPGTHTRHKLRPLSRALSPPPVEPGLPVPVTSGPGPRRCPHGEGEEEQPTPAPNMAGTANPSPAPTSGPR